MGICHGIYTDAACQDAASNGNTGTLYALITSVGYDLDSATLNQIRIQASDIAGNNGTQTSAFTIKIDTTPPNDFGVIYPYSGWFNSQTPTIICTVNGAISGIDTSAAEYQYSTDGNQTWSNWAAVSGVYTTSACTTLATNGSTSTVYMEIVGVAFNNDNINMNSIQFQCLDWAKNLGTSSAMVIPIDSTPPAFVSLYSPTGWWVSNKTPTVIFEINAGTTGSSGIDISHCNYAFSTTGSATPTNWQLVTGIYTDPSCQSSICC